MFISTAPQGMSLCADASRLYIWRAAGVNFLCTCTLKNAAWNGFALIMMHEGAVRVIQGVS